MKLLPGLLGLLIIAAAPAWAQCKDCGCKAKCSPQCQCQHGEKPQAQ